MLDLKRLKGVKLSPRPPGQRFLANFVLSIDYSVPRKTEIVLEGADQLPTHPVIFAMNHTDRYNYWPFQYALYRQGIGFTATWVKGKYYETRFIAAFMGSMNNIPLPSRGYVISAQFRESAGRPPAREEYRLLRDVVDRRRSLEDPLPEGTADEVRRFLDTESFLTGFDTLFDAMIDEVIRLNKLALEELGLHLLVFPQGTRSVRGLPGRTGLMRMAYHLGASVVPVGCMGSEKLYPGNSPFSKGGRVVYRIGAPLAIDGPQLGAHAVPREVRPLDLEAGVKYSEQYEAATTVVMDRINGLLDPDYQYADADGQSDGAERFLM